MEEGKAELRAVWVGEEFFVADHAILQWVVKVADLELCGIETAAGKHKVMPCAVMMPTFTLLASFRRSFWNQWA